MVERAEILVVVIVLFVVVVCLGTLVELGGEAGNGKELRLLVGIEIGLAVQVDGQRGDAQQWLVDLDEALDKGVAVADEDAAGDAQVAVEPRVPDAAAVRLDADLEVADVGLFGDWLDAKAGRIGVGADNGDGVTGAPLAADGEGDNGGSVACEVVLAARLQLGRPRVALADEGEARLFEALGSGLGGVIG